MRKTSGHMKTKSNMASGNSHASFVQEAFRKLSVDSHHLLDLKQEQEDAVICLLERRDVFAVMPTGYGKSFVFQLFAKAMEAISSKSLHKFLIFRAQELHTRLDKEDNFTK